MTIALKAEGIDEIADAFLNHRRHLEGCGKLVDRLFEYEFNFFKQIVQEAATEKIFESVASLDAYIDLLKALKERNIDPYSAADRLIKGMNCKI